MSTEEKIRKEWLIAFFIYLSVQLICQILIYLGLVDNYFSESAYLRSFSSLITSLCDIGIKFWIAYYCCYKKRGNIVLMLIIIFLPLGILRDFIKLEQATTNLDILRWYFLTMAGIKIFYWVNCLRLDKVNAASKKSRAVN